MASKPKKPCCKVGCRNLTTERYCSNHQHIAEQENKDRYKYYDQYQRDKKTAKFYNSAEWKSLKQQALIRDKGLCQDCLDKQKITIATEVDHIIPIKERWDLRLVLGNLRSLCHRCHMRKTARDRKKYQS